MNRYLRERATLEWLPQSSSVRDFPREQTLIGVAYHLANWTEWCERKDVAFAEANYEDVLRYQGEQVRGEWAYRRKPLSAGTANARADETCNFLTWAAERRLRPKFEAKRVSLTLLRVGTRGKMAPRAGRAKESRSDSMLRAFALPKPEEVKNWLHAVKRRRGTAKYLACRFIIEAGPRRSEVEAVLVTQWPHAEAISYAVDRGHAFVPMQLTHSTKGGRPRTIQVPVAFAADVRDWIDGPRNKYAYAFFKRTGQRTGKVFLSDAPGNTGAPLRAHTIYDCFKEVHPRPRRWSPHAGRHAFACFFVLRALEAEAQSARCGMPDMGPDWIKARGDWWLKTLQHQLGHMSESTTEIYLHWLVSAAQLADLAAGWHRYLEASDEQLL